MLVSLTDEGRRQPLAAQPALRDVRRIEEGASCLGRCPLVTAQAQDQSAIFSTGLTVVPFFESSKAWLICSGA